MFDYKPRGNKIFYYSICSLKGLNIEKARKEYIILRNKHNRMYVDIFSEETGSSYCKKFNAILKQEDKDIIHELVWRFGNELTKKQEQYLIKESDNRLKIKTKNDFKKRKTTLRIEEDFLYTLLIAENTDNFSNAIREAIAKYIVDNGFIDVLEKVSKILARNDDINSVNDFLKLYN